MNTQARIVNRVTCDPLTHEDAHHFRMLQSRIPGWSILGHQAFFKALLAEESVRSLLVCGVYHGLDIAIILDLLARYWPNRTLRIVGVDLFSSEPCADWPEEKRGMTWEQAFGCRPPDMEAAKRNCPGAEIVQGKSHEYLEANAGKFDTVYLDTSHDEDTVRAEIRRIPCTAIIAGDDYRGPEPWGVDKAVSAQLPAHSVIFDRIWIHAP